MKIYWCFSAVLKFVTENQRKRILNSLKHTFAFAARCRLRFLVIKFHFSRILLLHANAVSRNETQFLGNLYSYVQTAVSEKEP